jgi:hypothetical protein
MRIEYELQPDDWAAFGEYCARTSPRMQKVRHAGVVNVALGLLLGTGAASIWSRSPFWIILGMGLAVAWGWYWPRQLVANCRKVMATRELPCLRGGHVLEACPDDLLAKCDVTEAAIRWVGIRDVAETGEHVFVMLDELQGYTIPKRRVTSGDIDEFVRAANQYRAGVLSGVPGSQPGTTTG